MTTRNEKPRASAPPDPVMRLAWKLHTTRIEHGGGCHLFENGGRGPACTGPYEIDIKEAREFLHG